ncbi:Carnitinyl-CoA dehydratase [Serratia marcescens]|nr:Carnitinyl-CoA dehydratase [Serratia marcescens]CAI2512831.1 Carnitinyl-CoA dehydratase [Serratia marcescens]
MTDTDFSKLRLSHAHGVMTIAIDNPPVNVLDVALMSEISRLLLAVRDDPDTRVLVFQSANPAFFIAHVDMTLIDEPHAFDELANNAPEGLNPF